MVRGFSVGRPGPSSRFSAYPKLLGGKSHVDHCVDHSRAIAGFIASKLVNKAGEGLLMDIGLGIVGAMVGGFLLRQFGASGVTGLNLYSLVVAVVGAVIFLVVYHAIRRAL